MRLLNYRELKRRYELDGPQKTVRHLSEALSEKALRPEDFSIPELAEALIPEGSDWVRSLDPRAPGSTFLLEASEGGRKKPFSSGYSPQLYFGIAGITGVLEFDAAQLFPGDRATVRFRLGQAVAVEPGMRFAMREGGRTIGAGRVLEVG